MTALWDWAKRYAEKPERLVVGLMSGTSVDGIDVAIVRVSGSGRGTKILLVSASDVPYPEYLRSNVLALSHGKGDAAAVSRLNVALGYAFAKAVKTALVVANLAPRDIDVIASHGQTISHTPPQGVRSLRGGNNESVTGATLQIGDPSVIATQLGIPVVSDFRSADIALGGQGAPLVPYADWCLLTDPKKTRAVQNVGGIGNVTFLPANAESHQVIGFDTGPGNMLMDKAVHWATNGRANMDYDGKRAQNGHVLPDVLEFLLNHPFLERRPPKSAGREEFGDAFFDRLVQQFRLTRDRDDDLIATLTAFTAYSIADAYVRYLPQMPDEVIVGGGGARNKHLLHLLQAKIAPVPVRTHEEVGINSDVKEAVAFALLANETLLGVPSSLPSVTGAVRPAVLGKLTMP